MCDISAASAFLDLQKVVFGLRLVSHLLCGQKPLFPRVVPVHSSVHAAHESFEDVPGC